MKEPLVSVAVVTYNSSKTVIETLESIRMQTYPNIELVVSDDCSTDNTVEICRKWMEAHKDRFVRTELLTVEKNTGVSANHNRVEVACRGEWIKPLDGDDLLLPNGIETYIDYVREHPDAVYIFTEIDVFGGEEESRAFFINWYKRSKSFFESSIEEQYDILTLVNNYIPVVSAFYNKAAVESLGIKNDERIPFMDDTPRCVNLLKKRVRFHYIEKKTVRYRMSETSLSKKTPELFDKAKMQFYAYYCFGNDFRKSDKKMAVLKYLRAQKTIHDNAIVWRVLTKLYKKIFSIS